MAEIRNKAVKAMALVEKGQAKQEPDYFGAAYFGFVSLFCLYTLFSGAVSVPAFAIAPLFFSLLALAIIVFLGSIGASATASFGWARRLLWQEKSPKGGSSAVAGASFVSLTLIFALALYETMDRGGKAALLEPPSLMLFGLSFVQLAFASFPMERHGKKIQEFLEEWAERSAMNGVMPGLVALLAIFLGWMAYLFTLGSSDLEAHAWRFSFYFLVCVLIVEKINWIVGRGKIRDIGGAVDASENPRSATAWSVWLSIAMGLALAALLHFPITSLSERLTKAQTWLFVLSAAYAALAYLEGAAPEWYSKWLASAYAKK